MLMTPREMGSANLQPHRELAEEADLGQPQPSLLTLSSRPPGRPDAPPGIAVTEASLAGLSATLDGLGQ